MNSENSSSSQHSPIVKGIYRWLPSVVLLALAVTGIIIANKQTDKYMFKNVNDSVSCESKSGVPSSCQNDPSCCAIWQDGICRKGEVDGLTCVSKKEYAPFIFICISIVLLIAFVICFYRAVRNKSG